MSGVTRRPIALTLAASVWMAVVANLPLWRELHALGQLHTLGQAAFAAALAAIVTCVLVALGSLFAWRGSLKPALLILLVVAALGAHFMLAYGIVIDPTMAVNVLQTDWHEAEAFASPWLLVTVALAAGPPAWWILRQPVASAPWPRQTLRNAGTAAISLALAGALGVACFQPLAAAMRNHKHLRYLINPLNTVYAIGHATAQPFRRHPGGLVPIGTDASLAAGGARPPLLVLVLGETGRSSHFGLNGYPRDTTPELAREDVASWTNAWSCGTSTAASVPCMFSHLGRVAFGAREHDYENLLDVAQRAGLAVLWVDNQGGCKGVCDRVAQASTGHAAHPMLCARGACHDGILLEDLDRRIAALPAARRARGVLLVLHQMGSHGPAYFARSPAAAKRFLPECESVQLQECSREALVNAYDNSIAYTDHVLASTIGWLKLRQPDWDTAMLYVADHGESLGENNIYLHGLPYAIAPDVQKHVPWFTWLSAGYQQRSGIATECLRARAAQRVTHDHLFHAVLGLLQVSTRVYRRDLDPYASCGAH